MHDAAALIRATRAGAGLTQAELARRAGTSQPVISAYERGHRDPSSSTLARLIAAAGASLRFEADPHSRSDLPPPRDLEEHGRRLADVLSLVDALPARPTTSALEAPRLVSR